MSSERRMALYSAIRQEIQGIGKNSDRLVYAEIPLKPSESEKILPVVFSEKIRPNGPLLVLIGAQHNEYNGLFGLLHFFRNNGIEKLSEWQEYTNGGILVSPITNVHGFLYPNKENKWGYFVDQNSKGRRVNSNRHWDKTLSYHVIQKNQRFIPVINRNLGSLILSLRKPTVKAENPVYLMDFHETSLVYRYWLDMSQNLSKEYRINHWIKRWLLSESSAYLHQKKVLNGKYSTSSHYASLRQYLNENLDHLQDKTFYFFTAANQFAMELTTMIDQRIYRNWSHELFPLDKRVFKSPYKKKGDFVDASSHREWISAVAVEMRKLFYNLEKERVACENSKNYQMGLKNRLLLNTQISSDIVDNFVGLTSEILEE